MAKKPEVGGDKKSPPKKMTPAEQSRAFIEKAREIGVDESGELLGRCSYGGFTPSFSTTRKAAMSVPSVS